MCKYYKQQNIVLLNNIVSEFLDVKKLDEMKIIKRRK